MCQLIACNLGDKEINKAVLASIIRFGANSGNKDGTGILTTTKNNFSIWKTELAGDEISDLGICLNDVIVNKNPVFAHVRAASKGIVVTKENAHPFGGARFALAHNGRLYNKGDKVELADSNLDTALSSDSEMFLQEMEEIEKVTPSLDIVTVLNRAMSQHMGKFAFLVYDKLTNKHYAARGNLADLHKLTLYSRKPYTTGEADTPIGYVIATRKVTLKDSIDMALPYIQILAKAWILPGQVVEMDKNSVYELGPTDAIKIGELVENPVVYSNSTAIVSTIVPTRFPSQTSPFGANSNVDLSMIVYKHLDRIEKWRQDHFLTLEQLDAVLFSFLGASLNALTREDLYTFVEKVIPRASAPKAVLKRLSKVLGNGFFIGTDMYYSDADLEFPWMVNSSDKIQLLIRQLESKKKAVS